MGCNIHWVVEVKHNDRWVGVLGSSFVDVPAAKRFYGFYQEFGIKGDSLTAVEPRGLPDDISDLARYDIEDGIWDHSHSWATLEEFQAAWERAEKRYEEVPENMFGSRFDPMDNDEYRVVFAFDS